MDVSIVILLSCCTVSAILLTLSRVISIRNILKYGVFVDVVTTIGLVFMFAGTLGGMLVAVMSGLIMAIVLTIGKAMWNGLVRRGYALEPLTSTNSKPLFKFNLRKKSAA